MKVSEKKSKVICIHGVEGRRRMWNFLRKVELMRWKNISI